MKVKFDAEGGEPTELELEQVPRVGEEVFLNDGAYCITRVQWELTKPDLEPHMGLRQVILRCKRIRNKP